MKLNAQHTTYMPYTTNNVQTYYMLLTSREALGGVLQDPPFFLHQSASISLYQSA